MDALSLASLRSTWKLRIFAGCLLLSNSGALMADELAIEPDLNATWYTPYLTPLVGYHTPVSQSVGNISRRIDSYFGNDTPSEISETYVRLRVEHSYLEGGEWGWSPNLNVRLDLPGTKNRFKLLLESEADDQTTIDRVRGPTEIPSSQPAETDLFAGVRQITDLRKDWKVQSDTGIKLRWPLDPFARVRFRRDHPLGPWTMQFRETFFWFAQQSAGADTRLDFYRPITTKLSGRLGSHATWYDDGDYWKLSESAAIYHLHNDNHAWAYEAAVSGKTQPIGQVDAYVLRIRYRHRLYQRWLFGEIAPEIAWLNDRDYIARTAIFLRIEALFGEEYADTPLPATLPSNEGIASEPTPESVSYSP